MLFFRDFCSKWLPLNFGRVLDWLNKFSKKCPKWRSRVKLHIFFINFELKFEINGENYYMKKFMSLRHLWNFRDFWDFANFGDFKWQFLPIVLNIAIFRNFCWGWRPFIPLEYIKSFSYDVKNFSNEPFSLFWTTVGLGYYGTDENRQKMIR